MLLSRQYLQLLKVCFAIEDRAYVIRKDFMLVSAYNTKQYYPSQRRRRLPIE